MRCWLRTKRGCRATKPLWRVDAVDLATGAPVQYVTPHVVLATGGTDQRNRLGVPGELTVPNEPSPFGDNRIVHDLRSFEEAVAHLAQDADDVTSKFTAVKSIPDLKSGGNRLIIASRQFSWLFTLPYLRSIVEITRISALFFLQHEVISTETIKDR